MAVETSREVAKKEVEKISKNAQINEAYLVGLLWADPFMNYTEYHDMLSIDEFYHDVWGFYYELGRKMFKEGIKDFDDITVHTKVKEYGVEELFAEYGKMETIEDAIDIVKEYSDNIEYYFEITKKNDTIRKLYGLFGEKVLIKKGKYDYENLSREEISVYWNNKLNSISVDMVNRYEYENLYIDPEEYINKIEQDADEMLPFYNSYMMNSITQGVARGSVTMFGGYGNSGKSSIMADKFVMSCIENKEKLIVVLNEEDAQSFRHKIILSIMNHEFKTAIDRNRMVNNKLQEADKVKIRQAMERMKELMDGDESQIKVIFMDKYIMKDLEKIVRYWATRGYVNLLIDTHKVSDESKHDARWETFVEDMKSIYRLTRKNSGGLNLRTVVTFQLADASIKNRYLTFDAIGEGRASKNEAATVMMFRSAWSDELEGGSKELRCYRLKKNERTGKYDKEYFTLDREKTYYLLFVPKNRTGSNTDNGQPVLVLEPAFHKNAFYEKGWTTVAKDFGVK